MTVLRFDSSIMGMAKRSKSLPDQLRDAIEASGHTANAIGVRAGVHPTMITRFMKGERNITIEVAGRITDFLNLELKPKD